MKATDLRNSSIDELRSRLKDTREKFLEERFQHSAGTLKNPVELRSIRRDIARLMTVIKEKENEQQ